MKRFLKSVKAEIVKQHKNYFHSKMIYVSLFLWPIISFISAYYSFKPFNIENTTITHTLSKADDMALPRIILSLFAGERYMSSRVPYCLSKEKNHADCTSDLKKFIHMYPKRIKIIRFS